MSETKTASQVLIELESKVDNLLSVVKAQNLNIQILSNKLSKLLENNIRPAQTSSLPTVEATGGKPAASTAEIYNPHNLPFFGSQNFVNQATATPTNLGLETNPNGFVRTSRPETFDPASRAPTKQKQASPATVEAVVQVPTTPTASLAKFSPPEKVINKTEITNSKIPVVQRVVDKAGKSIYLADVEVMDDKNIVVAKGRTNSIGKWQASLPKGQYKVVVKKNQNSLKDKIYVNQDISIDGRTAPQELETLIIK